MVNELSSWVNKTAQNVAGTLLVAAVLAVFTAVYRVHLAADHIEQIERRINALEEFKDHGERFTHQDGKRHENRLIAIENENRISAESHAVYDARLDAIVSIINDLKSGFRTLDASVRKHHEKAEGGWVIIEHLKKDQHHHRSWNGPEK